MIGLLPDAILTKDEPQLQRDEAQGTPLRIQVHLPVGSSLFINERRLSSISAEGVVSPSLASLQHRLIQNLGKASQADGAG